MKINWKRVNNHFKVFILGVVLTLAYRAYQQQQIQKKITVSPQRSEEDRPGAPGRGPFLNAEAVFLSGGDEFNGNSDKARKLAEQMGDYLKTRLSMTPRVFCLLNGKNCSFLIQTQRMVAEEEKQDAWKQCQELARISIERFPTVSMALYRNNRYGTIFVGASTGEPLLRKEGGPFTLYPYFEGADLTLADK